MRSTRDLLTKRDGTSMLQAFPIQPIRHHFVLSATASASNSGAMRSALPSSLPVPARVRARLDNTGSVFGFTFFGDEANEMERASCTTR